MLIMDATLDRIAGLMKEQRIQDQQMIEYLGLPRGTFANWRRGRGYTFYEYIAQIADRLGVSTDYLLRGYEIKNDSLSSREAELIKNYRSISDEAKEVVFKGIELLTINTKKNNKTKGENVG